MKGTSNSIEIKSTRYKTHARICLTSGGSLQELMLDKKSIIQKSATVTYETSFASAILFPFANRIDNGAYSFQQNKYTLEVNLKEENNAIHGLVYNKSFTVKNQHLTQEKASITLRYQEKNKVSGFPFLYTIDLTYVLTKDTISLKVSVINNDDLSFPFNLGWHPYFESSDLYNSYISFNSSKMLSSNYRMIPTEIKEISIRKEIQIKDRNYDNCYILNNNEVFFKTPDYQIKLKSSLDKNYLQLFTPLDGKSIAIEPISAPPNSFNSKLGLSILNPNETYAATWTISLNENRI